VHQLAEPGLLYRVLGHQAFLATVGAVLAAQPAPITLVYRAQGSCLGVDAIVALKPVKGTGSSSRARACRCRRGCLPACRTSSLPSSDGDGRAISAEAAYMVWGFGAAATVAPWDDESLLFLGTSPQLEAEDDTSGALIAQAGLLPLRRAGVGLDEPISGWRGWRGARPERPPGYRP